MPVDVHNDLFLSASLIGEAMQSMVTTVSRKTGNDQLLDILRRNPPDVRVTSGQKFSTKIIYSVLQTSVRLLLISSQKISFLATPNVGNVC